MSIFTLFTYCIIGLLSFLIVFILRSKFKISRLYNTVFSTIIFLCFASIFNYLKIDELNKNLFIIFVFQFIFDFIYTTYILDEDFFNKRSSNLSYYVFLIIFGLFLNNNYINKVKVVFLTGEDIRLIIWCLIFLFMYKFIQEEKLLDTNYHTEKILDEGTILTMFTKLRRRFLNDIKVNDMHLELAIYSIMIYYNSKRSSFFRSFDNFRFRINGRKRKLGIMQVESNTFITDIESIDIVTRELKKIVGKKTGSGTYDAAISKYMKDDNLEVLEIYNTLKNFFKI